MALEQHAGGMTPIPDPTLLTTIQLNREITAVREILEATLRGNLAVVQSRMEGMDKALQLLQVISDRIPVQIDEKIFRLKELHQEKFESIQVQFSERDVRTEQTARDVKIAVDAALQAAKEAVAEQNRSFALATAKSEASTAKQIDAQGLAIQTAFKSLDDKIGDMKDRLTRIEGVSLGSADARTVQTSRNTSVIGIVGLVVGALIGVAGIIIAISQPQTFRGEHEVAVRYEHKTNQEPPLKLQRVREIYSGSKQA